MSEARNDTIEERPETTAADQGEAGNHGKHRGGSAPTDDSSSQAHGKHRRP
ncbi:hypothetical protein [Streptomyces montanisoli]|uniref:Uncharacterized protein n=1 Tax=Streptomyces montanisoli TaxID=2798581 RepID=A0A940RW07_9ACTN|nr:hypothetical protein [Streptomyces montanisoli]MBP0456159.1 hypothetical protein [Streptomyces montanisoli]